MKQIHCYAEQFRTSDQTFTFKINSAVHFSHSQNWNVNLLELQIWHSKLLQSIMFHEPSSLHVECPSYFLSEVRLGASKPVQDRI